MIDLSGIARQLHLSTEQIRIAADLLQQGYAPAYISRYRSDEAGGLSSAVLWRLKQYIDRQKRLLAARDRIAKQLPKDVVLDAEAAQLLSGARTVTAAESVLKSFRVRRQLDQSQERDSCAGKLLEQMIAYTGNSIEDINAWAGQQVGADAEFGRSSLAQVTRLLGTLIQCDTVLVSKLRHAIQRKAMLRVQQPSGNLARSEESIAQDKSASKEELANQSKATNDSPLAEDSFSAAEMDNSSASHEESVAGMVGLDEAHGRHLDQEASDVDQAKHDEADHDEEDVHAEAGAVADGSDDLTDGSEEAEQPNSLGAGLDKSGGRKQAIKMTPRQRRRRWMLAMLAPMRSLHKPLNKLTAYQHLMLGRGVRSQLIKLSLEYDDKSLVDLARDTFVDAKHPLAAWFTQAVSDTFNAGLRGKIEAEALADMQEEAAEALLEHATDELRSQLMRRPVRGHTIALIDTVGPKTVSLVVIDPAGNVLLSDELPCSAKPEVVSQNVVKLGELIHKHRVTLVALTNGSARRFMSFTLRELMQQSQGSNLRWTMADRSGADAYAGGRVGLSELATYNRRERAAIWTARTLQNPMAELLKVDISRLRLGSYQRELPQEPLKQLVVDTIADCVCSRGIDVHHAAEGELQHLPGVGLSQAKQIIAAIANGQLSSRAQFKQLIPDWPEADLRQALGWLRVFGSDEVLDATLIHPDDYRLAQRLIDSTELSAPPAAPPNWTKKLTAASSANLASEQPKAEDSTDTTATFVDLDGDASIAAATEPLPEIAEESMNEQSSESSSAIESEIVSADQTSETDSVAVSWKEEAAATNKADSKSAFPAPEYPEQLVDSPAVLPKIDAEKLAKEWQVGRAKLKSIAWSLQEPFADPRLDGPPVPLRVDQPSLDQLQADECLWAVVVGVADFGAFVELAPNCNGLIHISRLSTNFIEDPHQCVQVGDLLMTWVVNVDHKRNRVALTALSPAQRARAEQEAQERKAQAEQDRANQRYQRHERGPRRDSGPAGQTGRTGHVQGQVQGNSTGNAAGSSSGQSRHRSGQQFGNQQGGGQQPRSQGNQQGSRQHAGQGDGQSRSGRSRQSGRAGDGRGQGRGRDDRQQRGSKSVVVTSKKPISPISQAMKQGEEPLRSFSDLMQFYESKRTDTTPPPAPELASSVAESTAASVPGHETIEDAQSKLSISGADESSASPTVEITETN